MHSITQRQKTWTPLKEAVIRPLPSYPDKIAISQQDGITLVHCKDILYCQADSNYAKVYLKSGEVIMVSKTLGKIQAVLPKNEFLRVHQSYVVRVQSIKKVSQEITLNNGTLIPISRSRREELMHLLKKHMQFI